MWGLFCASRAEAGVHWQEPKLFDCGSACEPLCFSEVGRICKLGHTHSHIHGPVGWKSGNFHGLAMMLLGESSSA
jgi:hypothetical protein